jgi:hypothetical protein
MTDTLDPKCQPSAKAATPVGALLPARAGRIRTKPTVVPHSPRGQPLIEIGDDVGGILQSD